MSRERILMALVGGTAGDARCGMMTEGFCIPLAATESARGLVESVGEDEIGEWLEGAGVDGPGAGGLWVLSFDLDEEDETEEPIISDPDWRCALPDEIAGLILRQSHRASGQEMPNPPADDGRWTFLGALV